MDSIEQEFVNAKKEGRQPRCSECRQLLVIMQCFYRIIAFKWDEQTKCYRKVLVDEGKERPQSQVCGHEFAIWIGETRAQRDLGLEY